MRPSRKVRALFLGEVGSGKTSLIRCLLGEDINYGQAPTFGVKVHEYTNDLLESRGVDLCFWDCGGQENMHAIHELFILHQVLCVVLLNRCNKEPCDEYWLQRIKTLKSTSSVIVVVNQVDANPRFYVDRHSLLLEYHEIKSFHRISCVTKEGIENLRTAIHDEALKEPSFIWRNEWSVIREELEIQAKHKDYIRSSEFQHLCQSAGITSSEEQNLLLTSLCLIGVVTRYEGWMLSDFYILKIQWVMSAIWRVVTSQAVTESGGILSRKMLISILSLNGVDKPRSVEECVCIVELMRKFELCYPVDDSTVLLPNLLPMSRPDSIGVEMGTGLCWFVSYRFLPNSLFTEIMMRLHEDVDEFLFWRRGFVLKNDYFGVQALVQMDDRRPNSISIRVVGDSQYEYLAYIRNVVCRASQSLEVTEQIPCPCSECLSGDVPHLFMYDKLARRVVARRTTVECGNSIKLVPIERLVGRMLMKKLSRTHSVTDSQTPPFWKGKTQLIQLLLELFSDAAGLKSFFESDSYFLPIIHNLYVGPIGRKVVTEQAVSDLYAHGLVRKQMFDLLVEVRPHQGRRILQVAESCAVSDFDI